MICTGSSLAKKSAKFVKSGLERPHVTFVRGPIVASEGAFNNEATPSIAFACLSAFIEKEGYEFSWVDGIGEALGRYWSLPEREGYHCQGLTHDELLSKIPEHTGVVCVSAMFPG